MCLGFPSAGIAQQDSDSPAEYSVREAVAVPESQTSQDYSAVAARAQARTDAVYVSELDGDLAGKRAKTPKNPTPRGNPVDLNGFGVVVAVGLVVGGLFLLFKFGGGGVLLSRDPREDRKDKHAAPAAWKMGDEAIKDAPGLLEQIAAMTDRTAAMVLLLRHCLLAGGRATDQRFARSDTERRAFRRLPQKWAHFARLEKMLVQTELAHYGGRAVSQELFDEAMTAARQILTPAHRAGHV